MAYIGKQPVVGNFVKLDAITTSATTTFNLLNGGTAYYPQTANNCIVSLNGVIQSPTSAYTISGSTIVFSDALTSSDSIDFILVLGDVLAIGTPSDGTITSAKLASGTTGLIAWQSVQTTGFTAVAGRGYPCNTTSAAFTVTLPASPSVGDTIKLLDYAGTFGTNNLTLGRNGNNTNGGTDNKILNKNREGVSITYVDSTQGWVASSGVNEGIVSLGPTPYTASYLIIAGGAGGGDNMGGGGGAGGLLTSTTTLVSETIYTIVVGAGGARNTNGSNSSFTGLTTAIGGGKGSGFDGNGTSGGSGGGGGGRYNAASNPTGGSGTTSQGNAGGSGAGPGTAAETRAAGGGGGGSGAVGSNGITAASSSTGGAGGAGTASSITGSSVTYAGGGGGGSGTNTSSGSAGGGNGGGGSTTATSATANTGSGGGGGANPDLNAGVGGSGVVILSVPTVSYSGVVTGSPTITTSAANTIITFTTSGSYTG